jgi:O-antigen/teichoic acid export membrane protein
MNKISRNILIKNSFYNILGSSLPLIVALFAIPILVKGLGEEKFGILALAWVVIGYFSLFDFGIGRTLTKIVAENLGIEKLDEIPELFWTALFLMFLISLIGSLILFLGTPYLVFHFLKISMNFREESLYTFYTLSISIPIVTTTAGLRGVLEAYQKFGIINFFRTLLGVFTFVAPLICMIFTKNLFIIVIVLTIIRLLIWILYYLACLKLDSIRGSAKKIRKHHIKPILKISTWMSVSNLVGPIILYIDRFLIGALISAVAVAYYTTPYEVVTKILIIPGALTGVLFPAISSSYNSDPKFTYKLLTKSIKFVFIIIFPIVFIIIAFAKEGMNIWMGQDFAMNSSFILQLFAIGVLLNSIAFFPFTFLQSIGRPDITAKIHLFELPIYIFAMWFLIPSYGLIGAGVIWLFRIITDAILQFYFTRRVFINKFKSDFKLNIIPILISAIVIILTVFVTGLILKLVYVTTLLLIFFVIVWKKFLEPDEQAIILAKTKRFRIY